MKYKHPYLELSKTRLWKVVDRVIADLEANRDFELTTLRAYSVGYLCKQLVEKKLTSPKAESIAPNKKTKTKRSPRPRVTAVR